ncbi:patatin-like phospholipase [Nitzschia inconspicua]|uniref:Patatin-like phospholipase n=1 Tax=Nitzschia inconspicua TaxID=303405 RepID=A0A9K3L513_9STRA|nr:patatin-like phospholipase [Nitzschia inconspicua]
MVNKASTTNNYDDRSAQAAFKEQFLELMRLLPSMLFLVVCLIASTVSFLQPPSTFLSSRQDMPKHILPPKRRQSAKSLSPSNTTLRDFLLHPEGIYLAMAPSFFGFYGYFGALAGIEEGLFTETTPEDSIGSSSLSSSSLLIQHDILKGVAGASAGAMAAILLAAGISPIKAAQFCSTIQLQDFFDFPAWFSLIKGDKFEAIMNEFLMSSSPIATSVSSNATPPELARSLQLQDALIPVGISAFDLQTLQAKILSEGSMARAARASACFPILFEPVGWIDEATGRNYMFIDGGLRDTSGLAGLAHFTGTEQQSRSLPKRVVNMVVGDFHLKSVPGPSDMPAGLTTSSLLSISIQNLPQCGPWAMKNGPLAVEASRRALLASLDLPLHKGKTDGHFELHIDASHFVVETPKR